MYLASGLVLGPNLGPGLGLEKVPWFGPNRPSRCPGCQALEFLWVRPVCLICLFVLFHGHMCWGAIEPWLINIHIFVRKHHHLLHSSSPLLHQVQSPQSQITWGDRSVPHTIISENVLDQMEDGFYATFYKWGPMSYNIKIAIFPVPSGSVFEKHAFQCWNTAF